MSPALRRAVGAAVATPVPLAGRAIVGFNRGAACFYSDAVEIFRVQIHGPIMVGASPLDKSQNGAIVVKDRITLLLTETFRPASLQVIDESYLHEGHGGARPGGESHFRVKITADIFHGKSRVEIHRMVNQALAGEFAAGLHALAIEAKSSINR